MNHLTDESLNEYLDAVLSPAARAAAEGHLAGCPDCRARLEALSGLFAELAALPDAALERDLSAGVLAALRKPAGMPRAARLALVLQALAVPALLVLAWPALSMRASLPALPAFGPADLAGWLRLPGGAWLPTFDRLTAWATFPLSLSPGLDPPAVLIALTLASAGLLWLVGNAVLLRPRAGSYKRRHS